MDRFAETAGALGRVLVYGLLLGILGVVAWVLAVAILSS